MKKVSDLIESADDNEITLLTKSMPWLFGAGIAAGHLLTASSCTIPQQGRCAVCGGCVVAFRLSGWLGNVKKTSG